MPEAIYPPYKKYSPYFVRSEVNPTNDNVWARDRAGSCLEDVLYEFPREVKGMKTQPKSWVLGTVRNDGVRTMKIIILNGVDHHKIHNKNDLSIPTQFINDKGSYRTALIGNTVGHYLPEKHAVFCMGDVEYINYKYPDIKGKKVHVIIMRDKQFSSKQIEIEQGDIVEWINAEDTTSHTVFSGTFSNIAELGEKSKSPIIKAKGGRYALKFNDVGTFSFASVTYEPMECKIKVTPASQTDTSQLDSSALWHKYKEIFKQFKWSREKILSWLSKRKAKKG